MRRDLTTIAVAALVTFAIAFTTLAAAQESSNNGVETGIAACYSRRLRGHRTSSGVRYNPARMTAAHPSLPLGTRVQVTNLENGRSVIVLVDDRLSAHAGIIMDISRRACEQLKFPRGGEAKVKLQVLTSSASATSP
jgi:rare lipoprotein A